MFLFLDYATENQFSFQNPAAIYMLILLAFHTYLNLFLILILFFVLSCVYSAYLFNSSLFINLGHSVVFTSVLWKIKGKQNLREYETNNLKHFNQQFFWILQIQKNYFLELFPFFFSFLQKSILYDFMGYFLILPLYFKYYPLYWALVVNEVVMANKKKKLMTRRLTKKLKRLPNYLILFWTFFVDWIYRSVIKFPMNFFSKQNKKKIFKKFYITRIARFYFFNIWSTVEQIDFIIKRDQKKLLLYDTTRIFGITWAKDCFLEQWWTIFPAMILFLLGCPSFYLLYSSKFIRYYDITLKVIGNQWFWTYEYGLKYFNFFWLKSKEELLSFQDKDFFSFDSYLIDITDLKKGWLHLLEVDFVVILPIKKWIHFVITSQDVIHSWTIPSFGLKLDACPGRLVDTCTYLNRLGFFFGQCSEICGINHSFMPIIVFTTYIYHFYDFILENFWYYFKFNIK